MRKLVWHPIRDLGLEIAAVTENQWSAPPTSCATIAQSLAYARDENLEPVLQRDLLRIVSDHPGTMNALTEQIKSESVCSSNPYGTRCWMTGTLLLYTRKKTKKGEPVLDIRTENFHTTVPPDLFHHMVLVDWTNYRFEDGRLEIDYDKAHAELYKPNTILPALDERLGAPSRTGLATPSLGFMIHDKQVLASFGSFHGPYFRGDTYRAILLTDGGLLVKRPLAER